MNIISDAFRRSPNALQASDWLKNMNDAFIKRSSGLLKKKKSSPDMLVYFTLISATLSTDNILHYCPSILSSCGLIYRELRADYEFAWRS